MPHPIDSKTAYQDYQHTPRIAKDPNGEWHVRGYQEAKQLLQEDLRQAGFNADGVLAAGLSPVLYQHGEKHREQRKHLAKFFNPTTVSKKHTLTMERMADEILADFKAKKRVDLNEMTVRMALKVMCVIVGLKPSEGLLARFNNMLHAPPTPKTAFGKWWLANVEGNLRRFRFLWFDVLPAIRARKKHPQEDVISYMLESGQTTMEIWAECLVYGAAGIATTQEFISAAVWHIHQRPELQEILRHGDEDARMKMLHEILRLEPVIGKIYRKNTTPITVTSEGETFTIPENSLIHFYVYDGNADEQATGACPYHLKTDREVGRGVSRSLLSFGAGPHRCAGEFVALYESDVFLRKLFALPLRVESGPDVARNPHVEGYEFRNYWLVLDK